MSTSQTQQTKIVVIGSGFSGICMGIMLKQAGLDDFIILEKAASLGGTWRENIYPGAECDIPSMLYQYSFEQGFPWESKWSGQAQILEYQIATVNKYALLPHFVFSQTVESCKYDQQDSKWSLKTQDGNSYSAQHIVSAVGQLHHASIPKLKGANLFQGPMFHSANWNQSIELSGKRVAVIGNAASAVQFIPKIAQIVNHLTIFQRSANWMLPKHNRRYSKLEHWLWAKFPIVAKLPRLLNWLLSEYLLMPAIAGNRFLRWVLSRQCKNSMRKWVKDPVVLAHLKPRYNLGAKRTLFSHEYYQALARNNVELDVSGIETLTATGVTRKDGRSDDFDVLIYATGFKTNPFLMGIEVQGKEVQGKKQYLHDAWSEGAHAYLGVHTNGFPNLHIMYGPNTNLGHNSIILMIEAQANYILEVIQSLDRNNQHSIEVSEQVEAVYNDELQRRLAQMSFAEVKNSWYKDGEKITNNWAGSVREYRKRLRRIDWGHYLLH